jgi:hypothetical protein
VDSFSKLKGARSVGFASMRASARRLGDGPICGVIGSERRGRRLACNHPSLSLRDLSEKDRRR